MKAKIKSPSTGSRTTSTADAAWQRNVQDVQAEFTRLTHAVDEAKRGGSVPRLASVANILRLSYQLIDSWRDR